jgi:hypothetical protein
MDSEFDRRANRLEDKVAFPQYRVGMLAAVYPQFAFYDEIHDILRAPLLWDKHASGIVSIFEDVLPELLAAGTIGIFIASFFKHKAL